MLIKVNGKEFKLKDSLKTKDGLRIYPLYKAMEEGKIDEMSLGVELLSILVESIITKNSKIEGEDKVKEYILDLDLNEFSELSEKAMEHLNKVMEGVKKK